MLCLFECFSPCTGLSLLSEESGDCLPSPRLWELGDGSLVVGVLIVEGTVCMCVCVCVCVRACVCVQPITSGLRLDYAIMLVGVSV